MITAPQIIELARSAIESGRCLRLTYDGHDRVVEVHLVGHNSRTGNSYILGWQVAGGSVSGVCPGWKLMLVEGVRRPSVSKTISMAPRPDYRPADGQKNGGIDEVFAEAL